MPGWNAAYEQILRPHGRGLVGTWQRYDWEAGEYAESYAVDPSRGVILEGCGAHSAHGAVADVRVWVESPESATSAGRWIGTATLFRPLGPVGAAGGRPSARDDPIGHATLVVSIRSAQPRGAASSSASAASTSSSRR
jgi:hypothetical protein